jgi:EAL domain-containing protein (putative c-di-GMP-specific phosphodiesterase class I)
MMLDTSEVAVSNLAALTELGVGISVDDFGTGYSSLAALLAVPLTAVKLDRSIVQQVERSASARSAVKAMVMMCRGMSCNLVAEGVETEREVMILRELGCLEAQGYWFSEPIRSEKLIERLGAAPR